MNRRFFTGVLALSFLLSIPAASQSDKEVLETPISAQQLTAWVNQEWELTRMVHKGHARKLPEDTPVFKATEILAVISSGVFGILLARRNGMDLVGVFSVSFI